MRASGLLAAAAVVAAAAAEDASAPPTFAAHVCLHGSVPAICSAGNASVAHATFTNGAGGAGVHGGWPVLRVESEGHTELADDIRFRAAGFAEGFLTHRWIWDMHTRVRALRKPSSRAQLRAFISQQQPHIEQFIRTGAAPWTASAAGGKAATSPQYRAVANLFLAQVKGLHEGYKAALASGGGGAHAHSGTGSSAAHDRELSFLDILELNYDGDAFDIVQAAESGVHDYASGGAHAAGQGSNKQPQQQHKKKAHHAPGVRAAAHKRKPAASGSSGSGSSGASTSGGPHAYRFASTQMTLSPGDNSIGEGASVPFASGAAGAHHAAGVAATVDASTPAYPLTRLPVDTYDADAWIALSQVGHCTAAVVAYVDHDGHASGGAHHNATGAASGPGALHVVTGHNTWADYLELSRVFKTYTLRVSNMRVAGAHGRTHHGGGGPASASASGMYRTLFSSYPGMVTSTDDWYELPGSGLLVTETTTSAVKAAALAPVTPAAGLPAWLRVSVANAVARTGGEWAATFRRFSGGTYNCQWMIVDAHAVATTNARLLGAHHASGGKTSLADLPDGTLTVIEQSPSRTWTSDVTAVLRAAGLWVSANRPFSSEIRSDLGYPDAPVTAGAAHAATTTTTATTIASSGSGSGHAASTHHAHDSASGSHHPDVKSATNGAIVHVSTPAVEGSAGVAMTAALATRASPRHLSQALTLTTTIAYSLHARGAAQQQHHQQSQPHHAAGLPRMQQQEDAVVADAAPVAGQEQEEEEEPVVVTVLQQAGAASSSLARFMQVVQEEEEAEGQQPAAATTGAAAGAGRLPRFSEVLPQEAAASTGNSDGRHQWARDTQFVARGRAGEGLLLLDDDAAAASAADQQSRGVGAVSAAEQLRFRERRDDAVGDASDAGSGSGSDASHVDGAGAGAARATTGSATVHPAYFSYADNPRGRMLARLSRRVRSVDAMRVMVAHNGGGRDPESGGHPYLTIAARFDLAPATDRARAANGAIDFKVASAEDVLAGRVHAMLGPTHAGVPPFNWLAWEGAGFCGGLKGLPCGVSVAGTGGDRPPVDVASLCSPTGHASGSSGPGAVGVASGSAAPAVALPCTWAHDWGTIALA